MHAATHRAPRRRGDRRHAATGNIVAWQEAGKGTELSGYRVVEVLVDVGDRVRNKQLVN